MNRPILYRGYNKELEKWFYGSLLRFQWKDFIVAFDTFEQRQDVSTDSIGQFTGLYDSTKWEDTPEEEQKAWLDEANYPSDWKGRKIWEGDLLQWTNGKEALEVKSGFCKIHDFEFIGLYLKGRCVRMALSEDQEWKVIGNIHQTK